MESGIEFAAVAVVALALVGWALVAGRLERWNLTAPIVFTLVGLVVTNGPTQILTIDISNDAGRTVAEFTLALVLFGDAAGVRLRDLRRDLGPPTRLLLVGLPLTMLLGTAMAAWLLAGSSWWLAAVVGAAVAPTDAALGAAVVDDERVPARIRRTLNVESGLNDGLATPFVNVALVAAATGSAAASGTVGGAVEELAIGVAGGVALGVAGGWLLDRARAAGWSTQAAASAAPGALAVAAFAATSEVGGNGFIAAFTAGLAFGAVRPAADHADLHLTHQMGGLLSSVVWFLFGATMLPLLADATWRHAVFALGCLTLARMVPVALATIGCGFDRTTVAVLGWFGPRGLASVVFALLATEALAPDDSHVVVVAITTTVTASVVLHGLTSAPAGRRYGTSEAAPGSA